MRHHEEKVTRLLQPRQVIQLCFCHVLLFVARLRNMKQVNNGCLPGSVERVRDLQS